MYHLNFGSLVIVRQEFDYSTFEVLMAVLIRFVVVSFRLYAIGAATSIPQLLRAFISKMHFWFPIHIDGQLLFIIISVCSLCIC